MRLNRYSYMDKYLEKKYGYITNKDILINGHYTTVFGPKDIKTRIKVHRYSELHPKTNNDDLPF